MAVQAIQKNDTNRINYIKAGATGALAGYALKYILPLNQAERDEKFISDHFVSSASKAKGDVLQKMAEAETQTKAQKEFIKMTGFTGISAEKINRFEEPVKSELKKLLKQVNDVGRNAKEFSKKAFVAITKSIRPTKTFIAIGASTAIATAFVHNVLQKMAQE